MPVKLSADIKKKMEVLYEEGKSLVSIGDTLQVSHESVRLHIKKVGVLRRVGKPGGLTAEQCLEAKGLYEKGDSLGTLVRKFKVGQETIRRGILLYGGVMRTGKASLKLFHKKKAEDEQGGSPSIS